MRGINCKLLRATRKPVCVEQTRSHSQQTKCASKQQLLSFLPQQPLCVCGTKHYLLLATTTSMCVWHQTLPAPRHNNLYVCVAPNTTFYSPQQPLCVCGTKHYLLLATTTSMCVWHLLLYSSPQPKLVCVALLLSSPPQSTSPPPLAS